MYKSQIQDVKIMDSHTHTSDAMSLSEKEYIFKKFQKKMNLEGFIFLSLPYSSGKDKSIRHTANLEALYLKQKLSGSYAYAGLIHKYAYDDSRCADDFLRQAVMYHIMGFDGIKMLEGKISLIRMFGCMIDNSVYDRFFDYLESQKIPLTLHLGDPKEFWDKNLAPSWVIDRGWLYTKEDVQFYELMDSLFALMKKHKNLYLTAAHFAFMSKDMELAERFLSYPNTKLDLTSGGEQIIELARHHDATKIFFEKYQDRIVYGTDLYNFYYLARNDKTFENEEQAYDYSANRRDLVMKFLETKDIEYTYGQDTYIGLGLPEDVIRKIYYYNMVKLLNNPAPINCSEINKYIEETEKEFNYAFSDQELVGLDMIKKEFHENI